MTEHSILDMCCGSRMFWFNKQDTRALFTNIRAEEHELCDGRRLVISPDLISDFRSLPFADSSFQLWCLTHRTSSAWASLPGWVKNTGD